MIYRVLRPLSTGHQPGDLVEERRFRPEAIPHLVAARAIQLASSPPLDQIPGWRVRAEKLAAVGVINIQDFLAAGEDIIKQALGLRTNRNIGPWRAELLGWITPKTLPRTK